MSAVADAAGNPFPSYHTNDLKQAVARGVNPRTTQAMIDKMQKEIDAREAGTSTHRSSNRKDAVPYGITPSGDKFRAKDDNGMSEYFNTREEVQAWLDKRNGKGRKDASASTLQAALDSMAEQINSLGKGAAAIAKRMDADINPYKVGQKLKDGSKVLAVNGNMVRVWMKGWKEGEWTEVNWKTLAKDAGRQDANTAASGLNADGICRALRANGHNLRPEAIKSISPDGKGSREGEYNYKLRFRDHDHTGYVNAWSDDGKTVKASLLT